MATKYTWFPGHMAKAVRDIQSKLKAVDLVLDVRDARAPFSSGNITLHKIIGTKRRLLVLNKADLADPNKREVLHTAIQWLKSERPNADMSIILVAGLPNVGKSSLINSLKAAAGNTGLVPKSSAFQSRARCGPLPGVTRQMNSFQVCTSPQIWVLDTPGVMMPDIRTEEAALKLALIGCIKDSIIGSEQTVRHLLKLMQQPQHRRQLARALRGMPRPQTMRTDDTRCLGHALMDAATAELPEEEWHPGLEDDPSDPLRRRLHMLQAAFGVAGVRDPSMIEAVHMRMLKAFRTGLLGQYMLDEVQ